ncbi:class I mannose-6-phosphate isomerase [Roseomonas sp. 18066]|uniref:class I mannose-6-phosphate isomerase n=1 Tax=Roseomonas sp. 18066 TaxID=2681412 RepID=UPI00135B086F|nr:class I mannose-6-phosphate isomerase [Roseomonas sp. 18066]
MTIEPTRPRAVAKPWGSPWGSAVLEPWRHLGEAGDTVGEIWFERSSTAAPEPRLLLKLLFTTAALSIQVHPDDAFAQSMDLPCGKSEAWYILAAAEGARVALGLRRPLDAAALRAAAADGAIARLVAWRPVAAGEAIVVPAGTIHAIGAGLVVAEIQQRSDTTFRLFDHGRPRPLQIEQAVAAARPGPAEEQAAPVVLADGRTLLVADPHFILERIDLPPASLWQLRALQETWVLAIAGGARLGELDLVQGEALYLDRAQAVLRAGPQGLQALVAYPGPALNTDLLEPDGAQVITAASAQRTEAFP